jgi:hypothetical protein
MSRGDSFFFDFPIKGLILLMTWLGDMAGAAGGSLLRMVTHPFYYLAVLLVILQYRKQIRMERKLFHARFDSIWRRCGRTLAAGWIAGLAASLVLGALGAAIQPQASVMLSIVSAVLIFFRLRFLCLAYSAGVLGILRGCVDWMPGLPGAAWLQGLAGLEMAPLFAAVAVLHLTEAFLVRGQGAKAATPLFYEGKRGKIVGGYELQEYWPVPLFLLAPLSGAEGLPALPWPLLFGGDGAGGWTLLALPIVIGFSDRTWSRLPADKAASGAVRLAAYGIFMLALAFAVHAWPLFSPAAGVLSIVLHEALRFFSRREENRSVPMFVQNGHGLKILAVLPRSAAEEMGLRAGETVLKVNGLRVGSKEEMHEALRRNSAFCKLEVLNREGQSKFVQRPLFDGEHHQLGIVLSPDQDALYYAAERERSVLGYLFSRLRGPVMEHRAEEAQGK